MRGSAFRGTMKGRGTGSEGVKEGATQALSDQLVAPHIVGSNWKEMATADEETSISCCLQKARVQSTI